MELKLLMKMLKCIVTLFFTNFKTTLYAQPDEILKNLETSLEEATQKLAEIQHPLPVVLFEVGYEVLPPEDLDEAWIVDGKMIKGTRFLRRDSEKQIFFCPQSNHPELCLVPQEFEDSDVLECSEELIPFAIEDPNAECVGGEYNAMGYPICPVGGSYRYKKVFLAMYGFCYDIQEEKTLYTSHFIISPKLLKSNLLIREQQFTYDLPYIWIFHTKNLEAIRNSLLYESGRVVVAWNPKYQVQQLVPKEDMALGFWRKSTYQYFNSELQHIDLFPIWNEINENVRKQAIEMYEYGTNRGFHFYIKTGVFDLSDEMLGNGGQIYNMWVKMIIVGSHTNPLEQKRAVVILMNNFINVDDPAPEVEELQNKMDDYCVKSFCVSGFKRRVAGVRGVARCCRTTSSILKLFDLENDPNMLNLPLIVIHDVV